MQLLLFSSALIPLLAACDASSSLKMVRPVDRGKLGVFDTSTLRRMEEDDDEGMFNSWSTVANAEDMRRTRDLPPLPVCKSTSFHSVFIEYPHAQATSLTKCALGDSVDCQGSKCDTWSVDIIVALSPTSTQTDLNYIKKFIHEINKYCDNRTMIAVYAPRAPNKECVNYSASEDSDILSQIGGLDTFRVNETERTFTALTHLYNIQENCTTTDPPQLGGLTLIFTDSPCSDFCILQAPDGAVAVSDPPEAVSTRWMQLYYSGDWANDSCSTNADSVFSFLGCGEDDAKCKYSYVPLSELSQQVPYMRTCRDNGDLPVLKLLLIIGIPCLSMIIIALGCAFICYKKSNIRWRKFFLREHLTAQHLTKEEIDALGSSCNPPAKGTFKLKHTESMLSSPKSNVYSDYRMATIDETVCPWEIAPGNLLILENKMLGRGAFATVYKGVLTGRIPLIDMNPTLNLCCMNGDEAQVAIKRLPPHADDYARKDFEQEIEFMKKLGYHRHVTSMLGCMTLTVDMPILVVEFCHYGDLLRFLRSQKKHIVNDEEDCPIDAEICVRVKDLVSIAWQIADGMSYLSSLNFIHRDLAARNILLTKSLVAKISDFGLGRHVDSTLYMARGGRLPLKWMPPEALKYNEFSQKSDVWAFSILLYEVFSLGKTPFPTVQPFEMIDFLENGGRPGQPTLCPDPVYDLQKWCWRQSPENRPTFEEIKEELSTLLNANDETYGYVDLRGMHAEPRLREIMDVEAVNDPSTSFEEHEGESGGKEEEVQWVYLGESVDSDPRQRSRSLLIDLHSTHCLLPPAYPMHRSASATLYDKRKELTRQSAIALDSPPPSVSLPDPPTFSLIPPSPLSSSPPPSLHPSHSLTLLVHSHSSLSFVPTKRGSLQVVVGQSLDSPPPYSQAMIQESEESEVI